MTELVLDLMLGPMRIVSDFYFENQIIFNSIVLIAALYQIISRKNGNVAENRSGGNE